MTEFFIEFLKELFRSVGVAYLLLGCATVGIILTVIFIVLKKQVAFFLALCGVSLLAFCITLISRIGWYYSLCYLSIFALVDFLTVCIFFACKKKEKVVLDNFVKNTINLYESSKERRENELPLKREEKEQKSSNGAIDIDGLSVSHAISLVDKLSVCNLTPSERSELATIYQSLTTYNGDKKQLNQNLNLLVNLYARYNKVV